MLLQNTTNELIKKLKNFDINKLSKIKVYIIPGAWCNTKCYTTKLIINALKN